MALTRLYKVLDMYMCNSWYEICIGVHCVAHWVMNIVGLSLYHLSCDDFLRDVNWLL